MSSASDMSETIRRQLNSSVHDIVTDLYSSFSSILRRSLQTNLHLNFENYGDSETETVSYEDNCSCRLHCAKFVLAETLQSEKKYMSFFQQIADATDDSFLSATKEYGVVPVFETVPYIRVAKRSLFEAGGGSGVGFQVFCNQHMLLTAGFGGGGGVLANINDGDDDTSEAHLLTFGGGGGGGIQIFPNMLSVNSSQTRYSIGGGGGCGTCDEPYSRALGVENRRIHCGFETDGDALSIMSFQKVFRSVVSDVLPTCQQVVIRGGGGGGGGGGDGSCCAGFRINYGFKFELSSSRSDHDIDGDLDENILDDQIDANKQGDSDNGGTERYNYDLVGWLLDTAATQCAEGEDAVIVAQHNITVTKVDDPNENEDRNVSGDWCCRCAKAQLLVQNCLYSMTHYSSSGYDHSKKEEKGPLCKRLRQNPEQIQWITRQTCCSSAATDNNNFSQTISSLNSTEELVKTNFLGSFDVYWTLPLNDSHMSSIEKQSLINSTLKVSETDSSSLISLPPLLFKQCKETHNQQQSGSPGDYDHDDALNVRLSSSSFSWDNSSLSPVTAAIFWSVSMIFILFVVFLAHYRAWWSSRYASRKFASARPDFSLSHHCRNRTRDYDSLLPTDNSAVIEPLEIDI